ncbi:MAG: hypothetical protein LBT39_07645 [Treponema sp.]|jgi:hypothetical protein|nr:hypothetical protein [Treponema sp.]
MLNKTRFSALLTRLTLCALVVVVFCIFTLPVFIMLTKMQVFFSWFLAHGITNIIHVLMAFVILIMLATGVFLSLGLALISVAADWYTERQYRRTRGQTNGENINTLTGILNLLGGSITRLRDMSQALKDQGKELSRLSENAGIGAGGF